jgi:hypothetical protein
VSGLLASAPPAAAGRFRIRRVLLFTLGYVALTLLFVLLRFPIDRLTPRVEALASAASGAQVSIGGLEFPDARRCERIVGRPADFQAGGDLLLCLHELLLCALGCVEESDPQTIGRHSEHGYLLTAASRLSNRIWATAIVRVDAS